MDGEGVGNTVGGLDVPGVSRERMGGGVHRASEEHIPRLEECGDVGGGRRECSRRSVAEGGEGVFGVGVGWGECE